MYKERQELLNAFAKIPGLKDLNIPMENLLDTAEFEALNDEFDALLDATIESGLEFNEEDLADAVTSFHRAVQPSSPASSSKSKSITIRIPAVVLAGIKAKAREMCVPYQTLINRNLRLGIVGALRPKVHI